MDISWLSRGAGTAVMLVVLASGCTGGGKTTGATVSTVAAAGELGVQSTLPIGLPTTPDSLPVRAARVGDFTQEQFKTIDTAREKYMVACMERDGFVYTAGQYEPPRQPFEGLYPPIEAVRQYGYAFLTEMDTGAGPPASVAATAPGQAFENAAGACGTAFDSAVGLDAWYQAKNTLNQVRLQVYDGVKADARYLAKQVEWSACMARSGFDFKTPAQAREAAEVAPDDPSHATAVADYTCRMEVQYNETAATVEADLVTQWMEANGQQLTELNATMDQVVRRSVELEG